MRAVVTSLLVMKAMLKTLHLLSSKNGFIELDKSFSVGKNLNRISNDLLAEAN